MSKNKKIILIMSLILFMILALMVRNSSQGILFDEIILKFLHKDQSLILLSIFKVISFIGSVYFLVPVIGGVTIYALRKKRYSIINLILLSSLGSFIFNYFLKFLFQRQRPFDYFQVKQGGLSYPSGHSMVTMSLYMSLAYLISNKIKNKENKKWVYIVTFTMIFLMGLSRLYLGVHWPTDVIGGYLMGYLFYEFSIKLVKA